MNPELLSALAIFTLGNSSDAFLLVRAGELGVAAAWLPIVWCVFHVVKSAGNYGEIYDRHLGQNSRAKLARGLNRLWKDGGAMYAPPVR